MYNATQFSIQSTAEANYLHVTPGDNAVYDLIAVRMLTEDAPDFLLPLYVHEVNGTIALRYKLINGTALEFAKDAAMTKKQYITFALDLLTPFVRCKDWFLDYHAICIDPNYILRDRNTGRFLFVYLPADTLSATDAEILDFISATLSYIDISDDQKFQISMMRYFRDGGYTIGDMFAMFTKEAEKAPATAAAGTAQAAATPTIQGQTATAAAAPAAPAELFSAADTPQPSPNEKSNKKGLLELFSTKKTDKETTAPLFGEPLRSEPAPASAPAEAPASSDDNIMEALLGGGTAAEKKSSGGLLGGLFGTGSAKPAKKETKKSAAASTAPATPAVPTTPTTPTTPTAPAAQNAVPSGAFTPLNLGETFIGADLGGSGSDRTMLDDDMGTSVGGTLTLLDSKYDGCPAEISLAFSKPFIVFGRQARDNAAAADVVFPETCKGVSRQHLRISRTNNGSLTVTDLGSSFGTLLDGRRLVPNTAYPLTNGATLTLVEKEPIRYTVHI